MAFWTYHKNKKTGVTYVYETVSIWNKEKKQSTNKQICIGKLDSVTNELIPNKRHASTVNPVAVKKAVTATTQIYGPFLILNEITNELGMEQRLKKHFPDSYLQMLSIVYFLVHRGTALFRFENWSKTHKHPCDDTLTSQEISNLLLNQKEDARQAFFKDWRSMVIDKECLCYDITSVSSYSAKNEYVEYGYNRDKEELPQINLAMLFGQESAMPVYYKRLPGSIPDISTLSNLLKTLNYLGYEKLHFVLDKGFYCEDNINGLFADGHKFTIGASVHLKWIQRIIDEYHSQMELPDNYRRLGDETLFVQTKLYRWGERRKRLYVHLYYNAHRAAADHDAFMGKLLKCKQELEAGEHAKNNEAFYKRYFNIKDTPVRGLSVSYNNDAILKYRNHYAGFFVLLTNRLKDPVLTLETYRNKDVVENCFDDLKNQLDMKRLRVHSSASMDTRLFLQFLALIYISALRKRMRLGKAVDSFTVRELLESMESYVKVTYAGRYGAIYTELTKKQRDLLFDIGVHVGA
jgi:hypothetical protein